MTFVTPIDGQPAIAEHVAQITETLSGVRAEPLTLTGQTDFATTPTVLGVPIGGMSQATADTRYLQLTGGTLTGALTGTTVLVSTIAYQARRGADAQPRFSVTGGGTLAWGGGSLATDATLARGGVADLRAGASISPVVVDQHDLGSASLRWRKLWATDAEFTNPPTVGGVPIGGLDQATADLRYLQLSGGVMTGALTTTSPLTIQDVALSRAGGALLNLAGSLSFGTNYGSAGAVRLPNSAGGYVVWRDAANASDITFGVTNADVLQTTATKISFPNGLGIGSGSAANWASARRWFQIGGAGSIYGTSAANGLTLADNTFIDLAGGAQTAIRLGASSRIDLASGAFSVLNAPSVGAAVAQVYRTAFMVDAAGNVGILPTFTSALKAWNTGTRALEVSGSFAIRTQIGDGLGHTYLCQNNYYDATGDKARYTGAASRIVLLDNGGMYFDTAPSVAANAAQTFTTRMALDLAGNVGLGATPQAWASSRAVIQVGQAASFTGHTANASVAMHSNTWSDGSNFRAIVTGAATYLSLLGGAASFNNAPSVAAGAAQTFTTRVYMDVNGGLNLTPIAGTAALFVGGTAQPKITVASSAPSSPMTGDLWVW